MRNSRATQRATLAFAHRRIIRPPEIRVDAQKIRDGARRFSLNAAKRQTLRTSRNANGPSPCNCLAKISNEDLGH